MTASLRSHSKINDEFEQEMAEYLSAHHDFFTRHTRLLAELKVPHDSGVAVSLIEKQLYALRKKADEYHVRLDRMMEIAHENDALQKRIHRLTLALIEAATLDEVLNALEDELHDQFGADAVEIRLFEDTTLQELDSDHDLKILCETVRNRMPACGPLFKPQRVYLFGQQAGDARSAALMPLHGENLQGILAVGSKDPKRFQQDMGTDFLTRLSEIVSKTLEVVSAPGA